MAHWVFVRVAVADEKTDDQNTPATTSAAFMTRSGHTAKENVNKIWISRSAARTYRGLFKDYSAAVQTR